MVKMKTSALSCTVIWALIAEIILAQDALWKLCNNKRHGNATIYDFTIPDVTGTRNISLADYKGKAVAIVNVATY